ncbi:MULTISPECIES: helix-turn-helix domain-containing protein [Algoriphagus]|uniref:DNA-binding CsgD family transcriptional regulator n=2 Tax=Algoriphagus TaxID=246875 RepID=A0A841MWF5_9BACT|nr:MULTISPECIES: helix-turn-helix transcriptional regulator [Algoriphagus]MBB6326938.1 DNA-binding CsgD family transcriptional regulator [Algoriphagus iocasae]SMP17026.1 regulatory protein, luxR family [Algoriphagus winogradskyi]
MTVFGTDMHIVTFIFVVCEVLFFVSQLVFYLQNPADKNRKYYLILLGLLIIYNVTGGLYPDPNLAFSEKVQLNLAYGSGFVMGAFFPYYFYRVFGLDELKWDSKVGIWIFLIAPFVLFFLIGLPLLDDLPFTIWYGLAIPLAYAIYLDVKIFLCIRKKFKGTQNPVEAVLTYMAMCPWVLLPVFSYVDASQLFEVLCTNIGFIIITFLFIRNKIYENRKAFEKLNGFDLKTQIDQSAFFNQRCTELGLTKRECEVAEQAALGLTSKEIAEVLFISERTVNKHLQTIYKKSESKNRVELINSLNAYS